jgi:hypothetical protein
MGLRSFAVMAAMSAILSGGAQAATSTDKIIISGASGQLGHATV